MEHNPGITFLPDNNYDGVNPLDDSLKHPNKYELLEKRKEQIIEAINFVFKKQKNDVLKRPAVGIASLVRSELQKRSGVVFKNQQEEDDFRMEYHTKVIIDELCNIVGFNDRSNYDGLKDAIDAYLK